MLGSTCTFLRALKMRARVTRKHRRQRPPEGVWLLLCVGVERPRAHVKVLSQHSAAAPAQETTSRDLAPPTCGHFVRSVENKADWVYFSEGNS